MALDLNSDVTGSGPPVVVLHGLFGSATNWRSVARLLAGTHEVHALDLRNHGSSPWDARMDYVVMADDVQTYIDRYKLKNVTIMGHSMGGKTAMALALAHPDRLKRLIVVDIAPHTYSDALSSYAQAMRSVDLMAAASRTEVQRQLQGLLPDASVAPFLVQNLIQRNEHFDWRINLAAITACMPSLVDFPAALKKRRFDKSTTVIAGALSDYVPGGDVSSFAPMFPTPHVEVIADAGHWVHADKPQDFVAAVQRALER